jgi:hypothetical protein
MYTRQLKKYQYGGASQQSNPQQMMQQVAQMLQQGADPQQILQQLVESGVPQQQAQQMIQGVISQMQQGEEQEDQPEMQKGGLTDAEAKILYKNPRYVQSAVDAEKQAFIGPPEYQAPQTQSASQYIPHANAVGANQQPQVVQVPVPVFIPRSKPKIKRTVAQNRATGSTYVGTSSQNKAVGSPYLGIPSQNRAKGSAVTEGIKLNKLADRRKTFEKRQVNTSEIAFMLKEAASLGAVAKPLMKTIPALNTVMENYDQTIDDVKSKDLGRMKRNAALNAVGTLLPFMKLSGPLKALGKIPLSTKYAPYINDAMKVLPSGVKSGMKALPNAATKFDRTLNATTKGLNAGSKSTKPLITPFSSATRTFYGTAKGLTTKMNNKAIMELAQKAGLSKSKVTTLLKNLKKWDMHYKLGGSVK